MVPSNNNYYSNGPESYEYAAGGDEDDERNLAEIERELSIMNGHQDLYPDDYDGHGVDDDAAQAEMEAEMNRMEAQREAARAAGMVGTGRSYLPPGAVPSQNGVLSKHAAEFWFPECRNCSCCKGFKHGCDCCKTAGVDTCRNADCTSALQPSPSEGLPIPFVPTGASSESPTSRGGNTGRSYLPPGAVPSQNGVLSKHAAEFWFPECRNCSCCKGFKHGCDCCKTAGVDTCRNADCSTSTDNGGVSSSASGAATVEATNIAAPGTFVPSAPSPRSPSVAGATGAPVCRFFLMGTCMYGDQCRFSHGGVGGSAEPGKTPVCQFFLRGECKNGASCKFSHNP